MDRVSYDLTEAGGQGLFGLQGRTHILCLSCWYGYEQVGDPREHNRSFSGDCGDDNARDRRSVAPSLDLVSLLIPDHINGPRHFPEDRSCLKLSGDFVSGPSLIDATLSD